MLLFSPLASVVLLVNAFSLRDAPERYAYEHQVAAALQRGHLVRDIPAVSDELYLTTLLLRDRPAHLGVLVLGSSRVLEIGRDGTRSGPLLNAAVPAAHVADLLGAYGLALEHGPPPDTIVLGLDPWLLQRPPHRWPANPLAAAADRQRARLGLPPAPHDFRDELEFVRRLPSFAAFRDAFWRWRHPPRPHRLVLTNRADNPTFTRLPDGSVRYPAHWNSRDPQLGVADFLRPPPQGFSFAPDADQEAALRALLTDCRRRRIVVRPVLAPFAPAVYRAWSAPARQHYLPRAEEHLRGIVASFGFTPVGSFDPARCGADAADFYDGIHPRRAVMHDLLRLPPPPQ